MKRFPYQTTYLTLNPLVVIMEFVIPNFISSEINLKKFIDKNDLTHITQIRYDSIPPLTTLIRKVVSGNIDQCEEVIKSVEKNLRQNHINQEQQYAALIVTGLKNEEISRDHNLDHAFGKWQYVLEFDKTKKEELFHEQDLKDLFENLASAELIERLLEEGHVRMHYYRDKNDSEHIKKAVLTLVTRESFGGLNAKFQIKDNREKLIENLRNNPEVLSLEERIILIERQFGEIKVKSTY